MNVASLLQVSNATVEYSGKAALAGVDMEVAAGEIVALIGPNGAGKSTLLKAIMGFARVTAGEIRLDGRPIHNSRPSTNVQLGVSYLAQGAPAFVELTVLQNLSIAGMHLKKKELSQQIEEMLDLFSGLRSRLDQRAGVLSGGERQMLGQLSSLYGTAMLVVEQNVHLIFDISSQVYGLKQGRIAGHGGPESFRGQENLRSLFIS
jgi:branched-chain amino acid transport system ATP-binding protein